jgi:hypothetical protein
MTDTKTAATKAPTPEAHLAVAADHAAAAEHHTAAAHALKADDKPKAKHHARTATKHAKAAADQNNDLIEVYEIWEY